MALSHACCSLRSWTNYGPPEGVLCVASASAAQLRINFDRPNEPGSGPDRPTDRPSGGPGAAAGPKGDGSGPRDKPSGERPGRWPYWRGFGRMGGFGPFDIGGVQGDVYWPEYVPAPAPPTIVEPGGADWAYTVEYFEKSGSLEAALKVAAAATGQIVYAESVRGHVTKEDTGIQNANPAIGLAAKTPRLPTDEMMRELLVDAAGDQAAAKVLAALAGVKAGERQAAADRLFKDGKTVEAVEVAVEAAVLKEVVSPQEGARLMTDLRVRLRTAATPPPR